MAVPELQTRRDDPANKRLPIARMPDARLHEHRRVLAAETPDEPFTLTLAREEGGAARHKPVDIESARDSGDRVRRDERRRSGVRVPRGNNGGGGEPAGDVAPLGEPVEATVRQRVRKLLHAIGRRATRQREAPRHPSWRGLPGDGCDEGGDGREDGRVGGSRKRAGTEERPVGPRRCVGADGRRACREGRPGGRESRSVGASRWWSGTGRRVSADCRRVGARRGRVGAGGRRGGAPSRRLAVEGRRVRRSRLASRTLSSAPLPALGVPISLLRQLEEALDGAPRPAVNCGCQSRLPPWH